ncbi:MAG: hypothetical protein LBM06_01395 [Prevotellaceae bacterium]|jgi:hypothetical protein|nr:hypothetical protein [Prevotellaceae bacterium]
MKRILLYLVVAHILYGCGPQDTSTCHHRLWISNKTNKAVYANDIHSYPDTTCYYWGIYRVTGNQYEHKANPREECYLFQSDYCWEQCFRWLSRDTLIIVLTDAKLTEEGENIHNYRTIQPYMILQRYYLSLQDLNDLNWKLEYPPSVAMRYMRMWPPYEEVLRKEE